jgi:hypothetical protein
MNILARSELLSTFFPTWIWQGRTWLKGKVPKHDPFYWLNAHAHPVISTYYPPGILTSILGALLPLRNAFSLLVASLGLHVLFGGIGWYFLFKTWAVTPVAVFGAVTMTFAGYNWKQQPCFQYTNAYFGWLLYGIATNNLTVAGCSAGLTILSGYYPIGIQVLAIGVAATLIWQTSLSWILIGFLIGLPQILPFIKYLPKTIRSRGHDDIGKVPFWHPVSLIWPEALRYNMNGVGYWEMSYYIGLTPLLVMWHSKSTAWILMVVSYLLMLGVGARRLPRIPARFSYAFQFSLGWLAVSGLNNLSLAPGVLWALVLLQTSDLLWHNAPLLVTRPYSELPKRPDWAFNTALARYLEGTKNRVSGLPYPLFTGHINRIQSLGYSGGMQLLLMARWRGDDNSNGSGDHDFFRKNVDGVELDRARVEYAYTRKELDWDRTPIRHLYKNRRIQSC